MSEPYIVSRRDHLMATLRGMGQTTTREIQDVMIAAWRAAGSPRTRTVGAEWQHIPADLRALEKQGLIERERNEWGIHLWRVVSCCPTCGQEWPSFSALSQDATR